MRATTPFSTRLLPDGTRLRNRLLAALPAADYARILKHLRMNTGAIGYVLQEQGIPVTDVYFPNGGVFSVTTAMRNGKLIEVTTVGCEGMLGVSAFLGDRLGAGRIFQQVPDGPFPSMAVGRFVKESAATGPFRELIALYAQANLLQMMQGTACNAVHDVRQRCCRWLLQTHDRVESDNFLLKHEFLAIMLAVHRPTVTRVMSGLQHDGLLSSRYGRIRVLSRRGLEQGSCECYGVVRAHFERLGL